MSFVLRSLENKAEKNFIWFWAAITEGLISLWRPFTLPSLVWFWVVQFIRSSPEDQQCLPILTAQKGSFTRVTYIQLMLDFTPNVMIYKRRVDRVKKSHKFCITAHRYTFVTQAVLAYRVSHKKPNSKPSPCKNTKLKKARQIAICKLHMFLFPLCMSPYFFYFCQISGRGKSRSLKHSVAKKCLFTGKPVIALIL